MVTSLPFGSLSSLTPEPSPHTDEADEAGAEQKSIPGSGTEPVGSVGTLSLPPFAIPLNGATKNSLSVVAFIKL